MKKVRYALGAVGLAPVAGITGMTGPTATVAPAAAHAKTVGKTVHTPRVGPNDDGCAGSMNTGWIKANSASERYYWTPTVNSVCIGTVQGYDNFFAPIGASYFRVRIYGHGTKAYSRHFTNISPNPPPPHVSSATEGIHKIFKAPTEVCTAWFGSAGVEFAGAVCYTVG